MSALLWSGVFADTSVEHAFLEFDYLSMKNLRVPCGVMLWVIQFTDVAYAARRMSGGYLFLFHIVPILLHLSLSISGVVLFMPECRVGSRGRCGALMRWAHHRLRHLTPILALSATVLWMCIGKHVALFLECSGPSGVLRTDCQSMSLYGPDRDPVLPGTGGARFLPSAPSAPTMHTVALMLFIIIFSTHVVINVVALAIMSLCTIVIYMVFMQLPEEEPWASTAKYDRATSLVMRACMTVSMFFIAVAWPVHRRRQYAALREVQQQFELYKQSQEQLRQALEQTLELENQQKEQTATLIRYIFHEVRVPMNSIHLGLELLADDVKGNEELGAQVAMMRAACGTAVGTLSDALDLTKLERSQKEPPTLVPMSIRALVQDVVLVNTPFAAGSSVAITSVCDLSSADASHGHGQDGHWVLGDPIGLKQVLNNFVTNAIKFSPKAGRGVVCISAGGQLPPEVVTDGQVGADGEDGPTGMSTVVHVVSEERRAALLQEGYELQFEEDGHTGNSTAAGTADHERRMRLATVVLAVSDNGVGIPANEIPKLYKAFQQLEAGIQYKGRGTGLGLAISKGIVGRLQGRVGVSSVLGRGSVFYAVLQLPVLRKVAAAPAGTLLGAGSKSVSPPASAVALWGARPGAGLAHTGSPKTAQATAAPAGPPGVVNAQSMSPAATPRAAHRPPTVVAAPTPASAPSASPCHHTLVTAETTNYDSEDSRYRAETDCSTGTAQQSTGASEVDLRAALEEHSRRLSRGGLPVDNLRHTGSGVSTGSESGWSDAPLLPVTAEDEGPWYTIGKHDRDRDHGLGGGRGRGRGQGMRPGGASRAGAASNGSHGAAGISSRGAASAPDTPAASDDSGATPHYGGHHAAGHGHWPVAMDSDSEGTELDTDPARFQARLEFLAGAAAGAGASTASGHGLGAALPPTITVLVPDGTAPPAQATSGWAQAGRQPPQPVRVLVVEDVLSNRMMLKKLLLRRWAAGALDGRYGPLEVLEADSGLPAVELLASPAYGPHGQGIHVILMDGSMPGMDGYEATAVIRGELGYRGLLLGLTGNALPTDIQRFKDVGADAVLTKPADVQEILRHIQEALQGATQP